jgi:2-hydroxychromene-2-carboxylate isomerase
MMVDFYYDVVCPYAYMAFAQLPALRRRLGVEIRLRPILLGGLLRQVGAPDDPNQAMSPARARMNRLDIERWADLHGMPIRIPDAHPRRTVDAMRLLMGVGDDARQEAIAAELFAAYWIDGADVARREVVDAIARRHEIDPSIVDAESTRRALFEATGAAAEAGVFGVPTFVGGPELVWGQDRIGLLRRMMGERDLDLSAWLHLDEPSVAGSAVEFFHDVSSPFSYLAATQIERVVARHGAALRGRPILLGALFREIGTPDVPLHTYNAARQAWTRRDVELWADAWGVPFRFPSQFPIRSVLPQRVMLACPALAVPLYRAAWAEDRRVDDPAVVAEIVSAQGMDADAVLHAASTPAIKDALRANTAHAVQIGVCGVPTFDVRRPGLPELLLWGQDRLVMLDAALRGWTPGARWRSVTGDGR